LTLSAMSGCGSRPVSAMRPANTETQVGTLGLRICDDVADLLHHRNVDIGVFRPNWKF
jgi:hypothetical protein